MELMNPYDLKPHPRNGEFFDDMDGQKWKDFLQSVRTSGIIEPIIVTQDLVIVSGHQRVRAAKAIGILKIAVEVRHYADDDKVLKDLIETNLMQRGIGNVNPIKTARCIVELERIAGVRQGAANEKGNNRIGDRTQFQHETQADIAEKFDMSQRQLGKYKKLLTLVPELQDAVESGKIGMTDASAVLAKLPKEQQVQIAEQIVGSDGKVSKQELEFYKNRVKELSDQNKALSDRKPEVVEKVVEKVVEVVPDNYESIKKENSYLLRERQKFVDEKRDAEEKLRRLEAEINKPENERAEKIKRSALFFCAGVSNFIEQYGGYVWLTDSINEMEKTERDGYIKAVNALEGWIFQMKQNMKGES